MARKVKLARTAAVASVRGGVQGEGGIGGLQGGQDARRIGVAVRRPSHADRTVEEAVAGGRDGVVLGRSPPRRAKSRTPGAELYEQIGRLQMELGWLKKKAARLD